jgi:hypothetical protein
MTANNFGEATAVTVADGGDGGEADPVARDAVFGAEIQSGWDILGNANGGYLLAICARAMSEASGGRNPVTITAHYLAPGRAGPVTIETSMVRSGRNYSTVRATMLAAGRPVLSCLGTFARPEDRSTTTPPALLCDGAPPSLPEIEDCIALDADRPGTPAFMGKVDIRLHPEDAGFMNGDPSGHALFRGYLGIRGEQRVDPFGLLVLADAFPPTIFNARLPVGWAPTLELTVHVRALPAAGWLRSQVRTRFVSGGRLDVDGECWDEAGRLVVQSRQLALVPLEG